MGNSLSSDPTGDAVVGNPLSSDPTGDAVGFHEVLFISKDNNTGFARKLLGMGNEAIPYSIVFRCFNFSQVWGFFMSKRFHLFYVKKLAQVLKTRP